jgi:NADH dehydrogenase I D subunit
VKPSPTQNTDLSPADESPALFGDFLEKNFLFTRLQDLVAWGRKNSLWPFNFGLSCCYVEMATSLTSRYDLARFGAEVIRATPREADMMIVAGTVFIKMAPVIRQLYEQMMQPRWVVAMGACASSGGMYDIYSVVQGVDKFLPVDVYVPGCPPRPDAFLEALTLLQDAVGRERRPLSWVVGPQGVVQPERPSQRDLKCAQRRQATTLRPVDGVQNPVSPAPPVRLETPVEHASDEVLQALRERFPDVLVEDRTVRDGTPTYWVAPDRVKEVLAFLRSGVDRPYRMLYDLFAIDERTRVTRHASAGDFTVAYHLLSLDRSQELRIKTPLQGEHPAHPSVTDIWPSANWYEREAWDMFGIKFDGHPHLSRILMPPTWKGHPLRKEHPARATELPPYQLPDDKMAFEQDALQFRPEQWGLEKHTEDSDYMFLNLGPHHPGTHGLLRIILQLDGENIVNAIPDIGYHHRGAEKMGERQTWHSYIPYTDRIDYLGGVMNNFAYVLSVEKMAGIEVPDRAKVIRIMMAELFRISSHLVWYGTFAQDLGAMSPVFFMFNDREHLLDIVAEITGGRMHPSWFRIGGVAQDLPKGWENKIREFINYLPARLTEHDRALMQNKIFLGRTKGIGAYTLEQAVEWGVTGPGLRACGSDWDLRKKRPYAGYDWFEFDVPTAQHGDCLDRALVRVEEMRQSLRIIEQCLNNMPEGPYKADHPLTTPPPKHRTLHDIETLITHFLSVSWGPILPPGEACVPIEAAKGLNSYHLTSDGTAMSYRTRVRTPSFANLQMLPLLGRNVRVSDMLAILGSMDYVLADVDR